MPESLQKLIKLIGYLPWIWEKSATKLAFFLLNANKNYLENLSRAINEIQNSIWKCEICGNIVDKSKNKCNICENNSRDKKIICVVEEVLDLMSIENAWVYAWVYHVLWWAISPMNWVFVWDLNFKTLFDRISDSKEKIELIIATNPNIEWEATSMYLKEEIEKRWLKPFVKTTRLSRWLSAWYIEYADNITLINSINERKEF